MNDQSFGGDPIALRSTERARKTLAWRARAARQLRVDTFGPLIARELPWNLLLLLYVHEGQVRLNVTSIHTEVGAPMTTVLRWLSHLEEEGFINRVRHPNDGRIAYISLSSAGKGTLDFYFDAALSMGNPPL